MATCMGCDTTEGVELRKPTFEEGGERIELAPLPVLLCEPCTVHVAGPGYVDERPKPKAPASCACCDDEVRAGGCS